MTAGRQRVALSGYTTLGLGGPARRFAEAGTERELVAEVEAADRRREPLLVLGGGSNLVVSDDGFDGTVLRVATRGVRMAADGGFVTAAAAAGEDWDAFAQRCTADGLAGVECLAGIPGLVGAAPIQNVGAYGQEVAETITVVRGYDRARREVVELPAAKCGFGYRTSRFKRSTGWPPPARPSWRETWPATSPGRTAGTSPGRSPGPTAGASPGDLPGRSLGASPGDWPGRSPEASPGAAPRPGPTGRFVLLGVTFRLARDRMSRPVRYDELARRLGVAAGERVPLADASAAVLGLRRGKGMVLDAGDPDTRSAGSFFTNPVISQARLAEVEATARARFGPQAAVPRFPAAGGQVKVPAAWLIERSGFGRGYDGGAGVRVSAKHTLALVNPGGGSTKALLALAAEIRDGVRACFGIELAPEPVLVGVSL